MVAPCSPARRRGLANDWPAFVRDNGRLRFSGPDDLAHRRALPPKERRAASSSAYLGAPWKGASGGSHPTTVVPGRPKRFTEAPAGQAVMASGGYGPSGTSALASQGPNASKARLAGMVDRCRDFVGGCGDDREDLQRLRSTARFEPAFPETGERLAVLRVDQPGLLHPALAPPLIEFVRQAAPGG